MSLTFIHGEILDVRADGLVSTGNIQLNMSGGINGALMQRYGTALQDELHALLDGRRHVDPGFVHLFTQRIGDYLGVTYSVGVDGWYESSVEHVVDTLSRSFDRLIACKCLSIAFGAMATGYGHLSKADFGHACAELVRNYPDLELMMVERNASGLDEIRSAYAVG